VLLAAAFAILTIVIDQSARAALRRTGAPRP
jgi:hypothetical protein